MIEFYQRHASNEQSIIVQGVKMFYSGIVFIPYSLWKLTSKLATKINENLIEEQQIKVKTKKRPPRFVSFRLEIEPYNE